ncbi:OmpH family outer membrane protein, partial [bacterium]|nr:OmpH family outer membrane protein [bacterium]
MSENDVQTSAVSNETAKAAAAPASKSGGSKKIIAIVVAVILVAAVGAFFVINSGKLSSPVKKVGSIDQEAIVSLEAFTKAEKELQAFAEAKQKEFEKEAKAKAGKQGADTELQNLSRKLQLELNQKRNEIMNPLQTRAEAAVASVARSKGLTVVLDKRIVIYGIEDITEDVKQVFQQEGELKLPDIVDASNCPVAYFDQTVVRSLRVFTEAEMRLYNARSDMMREYENRVKNLTPSEKEALQREMSARLEAFQEQIMTPLYQKVTNSVNEVSKAQGISLVLDKQNVMYGGRNITDSVVETFLNSVAGGGEASPAPAASPSASAAS